MQRVRRWLRHKSKRGQSVRGIDRPMVCDLQHLPACLPTQAHSGPGGDEGADSTHIGIEPVGEMKVMCPRMYVCMRRGVAVRYDT